MRVDENRVAGVPSRTAKAFRRATTTTGRARRRRAPTVTSTNMVVTVSATGPSDRYGGGVCIQLCVCILEWIYDGGVW